MKNTQTCPKCSGYNIVAIDNVGYQLQEGGNKEY